MLTFDQTFEVPEPLPELGANERYVFTLEFVGGSVRVGVETRLSPKYQRQKREEERLRRKRGEP
jgi:hypothetical protein